MTKLKRRRANHMKESVSVTKIHLNKEHQFEVKLTIYFDFKF